MLIWGWFAALEFHAAVILKGDEALMMWSMKGDDLDHPSGTN